MNDDLLVRYLLGDTSTEENTQIETWMLESEENQKLLEQMYFILQATDKLQIMENADPDTALTQLKKKIQSKKRNELFHRSIRVAQRIAAILFIPILALATFLLLETNNEPLRYVEVTTNPGIISSFELPDGSKAWLNSGGYMKYPAEFSTKERQVELKGQGYFKVTKDASKPFFVKIDDSYSVEVLGTEFNVTAYENDNLIETTLVTGKVKLIIDQASGKSIERFLKPNQKAIYDRKNRSLKIATVNPEYDMVWKEGKIVFRQHPMEHVLKVLERHYNVQFDIKTAAVLQSEITAKFTNEPLPQVLEYLKLASNINFKIKQPNKIENDTLRVSVIELYK